MDVMGKTTAIVLTSDKRGEKLTRCLRSLPDEVQVVVLDGSNTPLEVQKAMRESDRKNLIWSAVEQWWGLARIFNYGVKIADGEHFWFLPDDLTMVLRPIPDDAAYQNCKVYGLRLNLEEQGDLQFHGRKLHSCGMTVIKEIPMHCGYGLSLENFSKSAYQVTLGVSSAGLLIPRDLHDELGGFDQEYFFGFEDMDLCLRARELGWMSCVHGMAEYGGSGYQYMKPCTPLGKYSIAPSAEAFARKWIESGRLSKLLGGVEDAGRHAYGS